MTKKSNQLNENTRRKYIYDLLLLITLYLLISTNFYAEYIMFEWVSYVVKFTLHSGYLVLAFIFIHKNMLDRPLFKKLTRDTLLFIPFLIVTVSNFVFVLFARDLVVHEVSWLYVLLDGIALNTLLVGAEELLFRALLLTFFLRKRSPLQSILYSSLIFGAVHLVNISSVATIIPALVQVIYTFFLGLLLATAYYFTENFIVPFTLHFVFNFFNDILFGALFSVEQGILFYTINSVIIVLSLTYGVWLYYYLMRKKGVEDVSNIMVH